MVGSSILPVSFHHGKLYFLFGKENDMEKSARGFSDFGGGMEKGETALETACREGGEELTGFLGDGEKIRKIIQKNGTLLLGNPTAYNIHIISLEYDQKLPEYYNANHRFLWDRMDRNLLSKTKLFEKIEIQWFTAEEARRRIKEFRPFYQEILLNHVLSAPKLKEIRQFLGATAAAPPPPSRKTKKRRATTIRPSRRRRGRAATF